MAVDDGDASRIGDIADRLGKASSKALGPARANLINKGIIYSPQHGLVAYSVPGMADFVRRSDAA
jgi:hypothetical protein